jgi:hypothetical protein
LLLVSEDKEGLPTYQNTRTIYKIIFSGYFNIDMAITMPTTKKLKPLKRKRFFIRTFSRTHKERSKVMKTIMMSGNSS